MSCLVRRRPPWATTRNGGEDRSPAVAWSANVESTT